jgi:DNA-binding response OmpR family regulator
MTTFDDGTLHNDSALKVTVDGRSVELTKTEIPVLWALVRHRRTATPPPESADRLADG